MISRKTILGQKKYKKRDYTAALKLFESDAQQGCPTAQYWLGRCYYDLQDDVSAVKWFTDAIYNRYWVLTRRPILDTFKFYTINFKIK